MSGSPAIGYLAYRPPPEAMPDLARRAEAAGFDEFWLYEDPFYGGPFSLAASALAATTHVRVGIAILGASMRHPVAAALEIATLARMHPGRFMPGFGHGVPAWMRQVGAQPASPLTRLEETLVSVRALLAGEEVSSEGRYVRLRGVRLEFPPEVIPPLLVGVERERSLALSGRVADGTIVENGSTLEYLAWAREKIAASGPHRIVAADWAAVGERAREALRHRVEDRLRYGGPQIDALSPRPTEVTDELIARMTICGTPEEVSARIAALGEAGADSVVLMDDRLRPEAFEVSL